MNDTAPTDLDSGWDAGAECWRITGYEAARKVLLARHMRLPSRDEIVAGETQVFSLAAYVAPTLSAPSGSRLVTDFLKVHLATLRASFAILADRRAGQVAQPPGPDAADRLATAMTITTLGTTSEAALEVIAALRVARQRQSVGDRRTAAAAVVEAWRRAASIEPSDPAGLVHFVGQRVPDARDRAAMLFPFFEMAAYGFHARLGGVLAQQLARSGARLPAVRDPLAGAAEASRFMSGITPTRVATRASEVFGAAVRPGDRLVVDISAANQDPRAFAAPGEFRPGRSRPSLAFGLGPHHCAGRPLAIAMAVPLADFLTRPPG